MRLIYIYHSCFAIETEECIVLIDYYRDTEGLLNGIVHNRLLHEKKKLYVLASHVHPDHFNREILTWRNRHPDIQFILSKDILIARKASEHDAIFLDKSDVFQDELLKIKAFGSTDVGISFLVEMNGKTIFHAGDLNNWHWNEEVLPEEAQQYETAYLNELEIIASAYPRIDVVMFPVDPRLGKDYMKGAEQFVNHIRVGLFAPMHFDENYEEANAFKNYATSKGVDFFDIRHKGQGIQFN